MQWIGRLWMPGVSWLLVGLGVLAGFCRADAGQTDPDSQPMVTARELVAGAIDLTRGMTSYAELSMIVHLPDARIPQAHI